MINFLNENSKILGLLKNEASIELAFQLILTQKIKPDNAIKREIKKHPYLCVKYGIEMPYIRTLKKLNLNGYHLSEFPSEILQIRGLKKLNLANNQLDSLPEAVRVLRALEVLNLSGNRFDYFPIEVLALPKLRVLYLGNNDLKNLPGETLQMKNLQALDLSRNPLKKMPGIEGLPQLKELVYQGNVLESSDLTRIKRLLPNCEIYY